MKKFYSNLALKNKMIFFLLSVCLLSLLLMLIMIQIFFTRIIEDEFYSHLNETTKQLNYQLEYYFTRFYRSTHSLISNRIVQEFLTINREYTLQETREVENELQRYVLFNYSETTNMFLISKDMRLISIYNTLNRDLINEPWYNNGFSYAPIIHPTRRVGYAQWRGYPVISIEVPIYNIINLELAGKLVIDFGLDEITKTIENTRTDKTGTLFILSHDNHIVYHSNREFLGMHITQTPLASLNLQDENKVYMMNVSGKKSLVSMDLIESQNWLIVSIVDYNELNSSLKAAQVSTITVFVFIMLALTIIVPFVSGRISKPLINLTKLMSKVTEGDLAVRAEEIHGTNEYHQLNKSFNYMVEKLTELMDTVSDLKVKEMALVLRQKEALIKVLQNQINPHLLYNSLDIIKSIAFLEEIPQIVAMVTSLADVYRYNAKFSESEVNLYNEVIHLEKYLNIMNIRFPKKFKSIINFDKEHCHCRCQKLILQPIVENAMKYAIEPKGGKGIISIISNLTGSDISNDISRDLLIKISDDGPGIQDDRLDEINKQFKEISENNANNLEQENSGLLNVHARLVLKYGNKYGLRIESIYGQSTDVYIRIPFRT